MQIDLEQPADIYAIVVWHTTPKAACITAWWSKWPTIPNFKTGVKTIFNNDFDNSVGLGVGKKLEYIDDYRGKLIDARDEKGAGQGPLRPPVLQGQHLERHEPLRRGRSVRQVDYGAALGWAWSC